MYSLSRRRGAAGRPSLEFASPLLFCRERFVAASVCAHEMTPPVVPQLSYDAANIHKKVLDSMHCARTNHFYKAGWVGNGIDADSDPTKEDYAPRSDTLLRGRQSQPVEARSLCISVRPSDAFLSASAVTSCIERRYFVSGYLFDIDFVPRASNRASKNPREKFATK
jgi:hypothetical protein